MSFETEKAENGRTPFPPIAYILLWFPKPSETFIFSEVTGLMHMGWPIRLFSLYGKLEKDMSPDMRAVSGMVYCMGLRIAWRLPLDFFFWLFKKPRVVFAIFFHVLMRRWRDLEQFGENFWAFFGAFHLARLMENSGIRHIHAPWANGPATAAWVSSILTGIPFSFSARAGDIYPEDGALSDKIKAAVFVRSENRTNIDYLAKFAGESADKIHPVYNPFPMRISSEAKVPMEPPIRVLAAGRFVRTKGFDVLIQAVDVLRNKNIDMHVTLAGDGPLRNFLESEAARLNLKKNVSFAGFVSYDQMSDYFLKTDLFVMPSVVASNGDRDGLPTVILEALAHGVPVVASDVCGISEVVINGKTGWLVPAGDPLALAEAIRDAVSDRKRALALAGQGRSLVTKNFDPAKNLCVMSELFISAAKQFKGKEICAG